MSSEAIIKAVELGKCYPIFSNPLDRLKQMLMRGRRKYYREFWALQNINFTIEKGETWGIIGRNGSGKSTLLQLVCNTLTPTEGSISVIGRVAALLELGAGFNPEFTGLENVYMACSLYGMSRSEIEAKLEDIIAFADIGDHLNQPVKTYSSGMYVRLGFAVIAHVDADILIVDEALAVGDAVFTQKCMRFIREFKQNGTLIFVSHDLSSVLNLCDFSLWLDGGRVRKVGITKKVVEEYVRFTTELTYDPEVNLEPIPEAVSQEKSARSSQETNCSIAIKYNIEASSGWKTGDGAVRHVELTDASGRPFIQMSSLVRLSLSAELNHELSRPILGFLFRDRLGQNLFGENTLAAKPLDKLVGRKVTAEFLFKFPALPDGDYSIVFALANGDSDSHVLHHWINDGILIEIRASPVKHGLFGVDFETVVLREK